MSPPLNPRKTHRFGGSPGLLPYVTKTSCSPHPPPQCKLQESNGQCWELSPGALYLGPSKVQSPGACMEMRHPLGSDGVLRTSLKGHPGAKRQLCVSHPCCKTSSGCMERAGLAAAGADLPVLSFWVDRCLSGRGKQLIHPGWEGV